jgi:hypothetical protein
MSSRKEYGVARAELRDGVSEYVVYTHYMRGTDKRLKGRTAGMKFHIDKDGQKKDRYLTVEVRGSGNFEAFRSRGRSCKASSELHSRGKRSTTISKLFTGEESVVKSFQSFLFDKQEAQSNFDALHVRGKSYEAILKHSFEMQKVYCRAISKLSEVKQFRSSTFERQEVYLNWIAFHSRGKKCT